MTHLPRKQSENKGVNLRADAKRTHEILCDLIRQTIAEDPFEKHGRTWAQPLTLAAWARVLGCSDKTVWRHIRKAPIRFDTTLIEGEKATLLRIDDGSPATPREIALDLKKRWKKGPKKVGIWKDKAWKPKFGPDHFGMLNGLAEEWPDGFQEEILGYVLNHWHDFTGAVIAEIALARYQRGEVDDMGFEPGHPDYKGDGQEVDWGLGNPEDHYLETARRAKGIPLEVKVHKIPSIHVLRRFFYVAEWLYRSDAELTEAQCALLNRGQEHAFAA